jgi:hypothetical protein
MAIGTGAAILGAGVIGGGASLFGASQSSKAAKDAANAQSKANDKALAQQAAQFAEIQKLLAPYIQAGSPNLTQPYIEGGNAALRQMQAFAGLGALYPQQQKIAYLQQTSADQAKAIQDQRAKELADLKKGFAENNLSKKEQQAAVDEFNKKTTEQLNALQKTYAGQIQSAQNDPRYAQLNQQAQQQAIQGVEQGALYQELARQGEDAILQNASATGGLRGGNAQAALGQFRPQLLNQLIEQQYSKLAGLTGLGANASQNLLNIGQASAAGVGAAGQNSATAMSNLLASQGQAQAAGAIGQASALAQGVGGVANAVGGGVQNYMLMNALNKPSVPTAFSGLGTGGFYGTEAAASKAYGGAPVAYQAPTAPGGAGGWYAQ